MEKDHNTTYHRKFLVQYHIIFVCKYRKKLMIKCGNLIKRYLIEYAKTTNVIVDIAEVDKDHIHILLILKTLDSNIEKWIIGFKQYSTYQIYNNTKPEVIKYLRNTFGTVTSFGQKVHLLVVLAM